MDMQIREATPTDFDRIGTLTATAYVDGAGLSPDDSYLVHLRDAAGRAAVADLLVATDGGEAVLGTVTYVTAASAMREIARPGEAEFRMLAVDAAARGRGVGEALVRACVDRARGAGLERIVLSVIASNATPQRLYRRLGFTRLPDRDWYPIPEALLHAYGLDL
ncbi:hypothetical protein BIV57_21255 [Mangrovactinospora gilvigrisea]|uniref:N-acetyltransferase domain-containing protein n=1 Tax=Mangrovactinospora gilvigrisea TaxID=1428644 RepID=A0A1J7BA42_9ACTN|nr:GNAT family N-acetyltransferase [Mangrovactinospora gilvigrisea]OIV35523.1 hypothetical protein BIV57_21255 [Mangrovactinospora gilvigrisea]